MDWFKFHIADYMQATQHLSMLEDGAYQRLLRVYYQQEGPIKVEERVVFRLCNALHHREKEAVRYILGKYFIPLEGYYHNTRADEEIQKYQAQCIANRRTSRDTNRDTNGTTNRPLDKIDRKKERSESCGALIENGAKCDQPTAYWSVHGKPNGCKQHGPF